MTENGRILETCQTPIPFIPGRQGVVNNSKVDNKEGKINGGMVEAQALSAFSKIQPLSISSIKPLPTSARADQIAEVSRKLPHPDSKFLSEVLTAPKMGEWSDFDDQGWLFQSSKSQSKKPKVGSLGVDETLHVWSEALRIESADICALPYVIPY